MDPERWCTVPSRYVSYKRRKFAANPPVFPQPQFQERSMYLSPPSLLAPRKGGGSSSTGGPKGSSGSGPPKGNTNGSGSGPPKGNSNDESTSSGPPKGNSNDESTDGTSSGGPPVIPYHDSTNGNSNGGSNGSNPDNGESQYDNSSNNTYGIKEWQSNAGWPAKGQQDVVVTTITSDDVYGTRKLETYGNGGGRPKKVSWRHRLKGWKIGGGERRNVYGNRLVFITYHTSEPTLNSLCSFHPGISARKNLTWGFIPLPTIQFEASGALKLVGILTTHPMTLIDLLPQYLESLPRGFFFYEKTLVTVEITAGNFTQSPSFFFVSDIHSARQMRQALLNSTCSVWTVSQLHQFGMSEPSERPESIVQYYRGDSAAVFLQGYDNRMEQDDNPNLVPNPPFPQNVSMDAWGCLNSTIGRAIPLMRGADPPSPKAKIGGGVVGGFIGVLVGAVVCGLVRRWWRNRPRYGPVPGSECEVPPCREEREVPPCREECEVPPRHET